MQKALATIGSLARPYELKTDAWEKNPSAELDLEESMENDPHLQSLVVEKREIRRAEVIVCIDTSLSMTGKKLAITAVSLAVLALQLDPEDLAIITFETGADLIKKLNEKKTVYQILEKFMDVPARGLTNIEAGLKLAKKQADSGKLPRKAVILMTDGRFTAGGDPTHVAPLLPRLHVIQTGNPWASARFCRSLAKAGGGKHVRVSRIEHLPKALYSLVNDIVR